MDSAATVRAQNRNNLVLLAGAAVLLVAFLALEPALKCGHVDLDLYLVGSGEDATRTAGRAFYPVFHASLALDRAVWRDHEPGYHIQSLVLHSAAVVLVFALARRLLTDSGAAAGPALAGAALAAALFGGHPVNVEPAVWVQGRDVLLGGVFSLACITCCVRRERAPRSQRLAWRVAAGLFFLAACLSHAGVVSVPVILVAYGLLVRKRRLRVVVRGVWELWLLAAATAVLRWPGVLVQPVSPEIGSEEVVNTTLAMKLRGMVEEIGSLVLPTDLVPLYPRREGPWTFVLAAVGVGLAAGSGALIWRLARRGPGARLVAFALAWFWLGLVPGLGHQLARADRHLYLPAVGLFLLAGHALARVPRAGRSLVAAGGVAALCVGVLIPLSRRQCEVWRDSVSLWAHAARVNPRQSGAFNSLGYALAREGRFDGAIGAFRRAVNLAPHRAQALYNLAIVLQREERLEEAAHYYRRAIRNRPGFTLAYNNLGMILARQGHADEAEEAFRAAIRSGPGFDQPHYHLGRLLVRQQRLTEALAALRAAVEANPRFVEAHHAYAEALCMAGRHAEAEAPLRRVLRLQPDNVPARRNLARVLIHLGRSAEAEAVLRGDREVP